MQTAEIRQRLLDHFASAGTPSCPCASLISPDPSLLFAVAGMVPFIPYMTGREPAPWPRATSVQKCVRTLDIEEVGKTTRHGTFFQMNGNFSFGDYFKEGAITYAWELVTGPGRRRRARLRPGHDLGHRLPRRRRGRRRSGSRSRACPTSGSSVAAGGQLLVHRRARPGRPVLGDLRRPRPRVRRGRRPGRRRGPVPRDLEPRLHAVRASDGAGKEDFPISASCRRRTSTPAWAWSGSRTCCRASTTCTRSTRSRRSCARGRSSPASRTARPRGRRAAARGRRPRPQRR